MYMYMYVLWISGNMYSTLHILYQVQKFIKLCNDYNVGTYYPHPLNSYAIITLASWVSCFKGLPHQVSSKHLHVQSILVLGIVPAATLGLGTYPDKWSCSRIWEIWENCLNTSTVPAGTGLNTYYIGTNRPLSLHPKQVWTLVYLRTMF